MANFYSNVTAVIEEFADTMGQDRWTSSSSHLSRPEYKRQAQAAMDLVMQRDRTRHKKQCEGCGAREYERKQNVLRCSYCGGIW
jgi:hypothetical protein